MEEMSRRGMFGFFAGVSAGLLVDPMIAPPVKAAEMPPLPELEITDLSKPGAVTRAMLRSHCGDEIYRSWFRSVEFESFDGKTATFSVPLKFIRNWINEHYKDDLLLCARAEIPRAQHVCVTWRSPQRDREADRIQSEARVRAVMDTI
jgi:chromosomal replication initiator protein